MAAFFLTSLIVFSFCLSSFAHPSSQTFLTASEILSNSGYLSMGLTLQVISESIALNSSTAIVFAPSDIAFIQLGQPSLLLLQYHISPLRLSIENLKALPFGTTIPTLAPNHPLVITSVTEGDLSINNVKVQESALFDDGSVVVYGIDEFFNFSFQISPNLAPITEPISPAPLGHEPSLLISPASLGHEPSSGSDVDSFDSASDLLRSRGYLKMATFLDLQLSGFTDETKWTIFAPVDEAVDAQVRNFSDYSKIFRRHVVPSLLTWSDLVNVDDGATLPTFLEGFTINVARSGDVLVLNGVPVIFPDMYNSDWLVVHGLNQLVMSTTNRESMGDSISEFDGGNSPDYGEY